MVQFDVDRNLIALALRKNTTHAVFWVACGPFIVIAEPPPSSGRKRAVPTYTIQSTSVGFAALVQAGNSTGGNPTATTSSANTTGTGTSTSTTLPTTSAGAATNASLTQGASVASANASVAITAIPPSESVRSATNENEVGNTDATAAFSPWAISTIVLAVLLACVLLGLLEYFVVLRRCSRAPTTDIDASTAAVQPKTYQHQQHIEMNTARDASPLSERAPGYSIPSPPVSSPSNYDQVPPIAAAAAATSDSIKPW
jgi:hypothetical protein